MVNPKSGWLVSGFQSIVAACVVTMVAMGCASPPGPDGSGEESMVQTIDDVTVEREGDESVVRLVGLVDPIYSVTTSEDDMIAVVDLVGIDATSIDGAQVAAYDGVVDLVTASTFDDGSDTPLTRVEVAMTGPGRPEIYSSGDGLEIRVVPLDPEAMDESPSWASEDASESLAMEEETSTEDDSIWAGSETLDTEEAGLAGDEAIDMAIATPAITPPAATRLTGVSVSTTPGGVLVGLQADGEIGNIQAFTIADPARLVIDLPGLQAANLPARTNVDSTQVAGIRTGSHADKVRVVVDGGPEAGEFEGRQIMPGTTGLWVAIGDGEELAQSMTDALEADEAAWLASQPTPAPMPEGDMLAMGSDETDMESLPASMDGGEMAGEMASEPGADVVVPTAEGLAQVYGLHFERTEGLDRTAILSDEAVAYTTSSPDPATLVVLIPDASISPEASDRIFPQVGGPISMIHAFQQPEVTTPEVRVVFTRAPGQEPVITRRGSMLFVDFQDMGVAAAPPPAFPDAGAPQGATPTPMPSSNMAATAPETAPMPMATTTEMPAGEMAMGMGMPMEPMGQPTALPPAVPGMELGGDMPGFDPMGADPAAVPTAMDTGLDPVFVPPVASTAPPAAVEVPAAIDVLEEGGLIDGKEYRGRRVSLDFKDVEIADVLRLIAEVSDLNIIAGDEVDGKVTIRLVDTPWDQALDVILMTKGLGFVRVGNVLRIAPADVLKAEEEVRLQERRNKEKLEDLEVKLLPVNYAAVKDTEGLVKRLLSARGTVNLDERTNTLIIKDISSVIDEATALIAAIDTQTPQVMIEAKIVEANLDFSRELGSVWGVQTNQFEDAFDPDTPRRDLGSEDVRFIDDNSLVFANPITSVPTGLLTLGALVLDENFRVDAQIQAAESTGDGKVVSSPRIVTLDNKEAKIEQGVSIPFQTFEGGDAKLEFVDAVLSLVVTPHITADKSIIMEIEVTRNAPDDSVQTPTGSPAIAKNVAETETLVKDGQTLVLGGIYTIIKSQRQSRIPYLHRIPVIGNAFKNNEVTDARKELLVFVTPRIVQLPEMAAN